MHSRLYYAPLALCIGLFCSACGPTEIQEASREELQSRMLEGLKSLKSSGRFGSFSSGSYSAGADWGLLEKDLLDRLASPKVEWAKMSKIERERHMARSVMPVMLLLFEAHDQPSSSRFGSRSFSCLTCHGDSTTTVVDATTFDFSSPTHLLPLDPNNMPTENDKDFATARAVMFMKSTIVPAMRILLGRKDADCFTCHAKKK